MLKTANLVNNPSVERLVELWAARYTPDLSTLYTEGERFTISELIATASPAGRNKTVAKLKRLLQINCESAGIKTNVLFSYAPNVVNLADSQRIASFAAQVYQQALSIYQVQSLPTAEFAATPLAVALDRSSEKPDFQSDIFTQRVMPALELPAIEQLATTLEPALLELQEQHLLSKDPRTIGFITTQFHFSSKLVLQKLTLCEQVLLSPYFRFVEEQVCIPWQRVCSAAAWHTLDSPWMSVIQQMLPATHEIAHAVYHNTAPLYPNHSSRRGRLNEPGIIASTIRDLQMFQGYLWLCVLEQSMAAVEQELLPLCVMVFPSVEVKWELVQHMLSILMDEIMERVKPEYKRLVLPYTQAMQQLFSQSPPSLLPDEV